MVRTDRTLPYYAGDDNPNLDRLRDILLTYSFYNFDLGYCQVSMDFIATKMSAALGVHFEHNITLEE